MNITMNMNAGMNMDMIGSCIRVNSNGTVNVLIEWKNENENGNSTKCSESGSGGALRRQAYKARGRLNRCHGLFKQIVEMQYERKNDVVDNLCDKLKEYSLNDIQDSRYGYYNDSSQKYNRNIPYTGTLSTLPRVPIHYYNLGASDPVNDRKWKHDGYEVMQEYQKTLEKKNQHTQQQSRPIPHTHSPSSSSQHTTTDIQPSSHSHPLASAPSSYRISSSSISAPLLEVNVQTPLGTRILHYYQGDQPLRICEEFCATIGQPHKTQALHQWLLNIIKQQETTTRQVNKER